MGEPFVPCACQYYGAINGAISAGHLFLAVLYSVEFSGMDGGGGEQPPVALAEGTDGMAYIIHCKRLHGPQRPLKEVPWRHHTQILVLTREST